jgi:hypothetical protein
MYTQVKLQVFNSIEISVKRLILKNREIKHSDFQILIWVWQIYTKNKNIWYERYNKIFTKLKLSRKVRSHIEMIRLQGSKMIWIWRDWWCTKYVSLKIFRDQNENLGWLLIRSKSYLKIEVDVFVCSNVNVWRMLHVFVTAKHENAGWDDANELKEHESKQEPSNVYKMTAYLCDYFSIATTDVIVVCWEWLGCASLAIVRFRWNS